MEKKEKIESNSQENDQDILKQLLHTPESRILALGLVAAIIGIIVLALSWLWSPEKFQVLVAMTATNILFGRAAGLSVGYSMNLGHIIVLPVNMITETILVLLFYPLFVLSWNRLLVIPALKKIIERTSKAAEAHNEKIRKFGMLGLFVFVWSPFWMTGPMVGCAIGYLIGFSSIFTLTVVLSGTYLAITCWALLLFQLQGHFSRYSSFAPFILLGIIICVVITSKIWYGMREKKRSKKRFEKTKK
ncbi:small multi-drug export protein [Candidatus Latescibacterota bacterium]